MKFFVIHGYCSPDNYTADGDGPVLELSEFDTAKAVEEFHAKWLEDIGADHDDVSDVTFRVIEGTERRLVPVEKVTKHKLQ